LKVTDEELFPPIADKLLKREKLRQEVLNRHPHYRKKRRHKPKWKGYIWWIMPDPPSLYAPIHQTLRNSRSGEIAG
jgi:hypothetical protein